MALCGKISSRRKKPKSFAIGVDAKAVLRFQAGDTHGDHVVLLVTERAGNAYLAHLQQAGVSYLFCGKKEVDLAVALDKIVQNWGLKKLMLEGGGAFNGSMIHAGLVDEVSHITVPVIDGGRDVAGFFDIPGQTPAMAAATLKLKSHELLPGGCIWAKYKVVGRPG
ncbi:MAG: dihydrofolate reductase family protein [Tepidisphaeraceae bacterium]